MNTKIEFLNGPITEAGLYLFKYKASGSYELAIVMEDNEDENSFFVTDYPQCKVTQPLENVSRFEWVKL